MSKAREAAMAADLREQAELARLRQASRQTASLAQARSDAKALRRALDLAEQRLDVALSLREQVSKPYAAPAPKPGRHNGAFVLLCSDWHVGEQVMPESVGGRNEYTPAIARKRLDNLIEGSKWMIESWRTGDTGFGWNIDQAVIWLGGDMITGMIHDDLRETNLLSPTEEVLLAQELCIRLIDAIAAHPGIKRVEVPTSWGNHGRDTPERRVSTGWSRSYEWLMYQQIARHYAKSKVVRVHTGKDEISSLEVLGTKLRFNHGDIIRFGDGVGGITIPLKKWLAKLDRTERADVTCIGHWHQYLDIGNAVVNNCLIGHNAYGQRVAPYAAPSQVAFLVDQRHGKRLSTEIFV